MLACITSDTHSVYVYGSSTQVHKVVLILYSDKQTISKLDLLDIASRSHIGVYRNAESADNQNLITEVYKVYYALYGIVCYEN